MNAPSAPRLASFGGRPGPDHLAPDLRAFDELPESAREGLWYVLGPALADPLPDDFDPMVAAFCRDFDADPGHVARVVRGARTLLRAAVAHGVDGPALARDVDALVGPGRGARTTLLAGFDAAREVIQREYLDRTLAEHGSVLLGMSWRLDRVAASSFSTALDRPVFLLSLKVKQGERTERVQLQALPETLRELHAQLGRLLGQREG